MARKKRNTWTDEHGEMIRLYNETTDTVEREKILRKLIPKINEFIEVVLHRYGMLFIQEEKRDLYVDLLLFVIDRFHLITDYKKADSYIFFLLRNQMISLGKKKEVQIRREEEYLSHQSDYVEPFDYEIVDTTVTREDIIKRFYAGVKKYRQPTLVKITDTIMEWMRTSETLEVEDMLHFIKKKHPNINSRRFYEYTFRANLNIKLKNSMKGKKVVDILG